MSRSDQRPADLRPYPADGGNPTLRTRDRAHPGLRPLGLLKDVGLQGTVVTTYAATVEESALPHFGYRALVPAILRRLPLAPASP